MNLEDRIKALEDRRDPQGQTVGLIRYQGEPRIDTSRVRARYLYVAYMPQRNRPEPRQ